MLRVSDYCNRRNFGGLIFGLRPALRDGYDARMNEKDLARYFLLDPNGGGLRFTEPGIWAFRQRFARIGVDIREIKTIEGFRECYDVLFSVELRDAALHNTSPAIDKALSEIPAYREGVKLRDGE